VWNQQPAYAGRSPKSYSLSAEKSEKIGETITPAGIRGEGVND
jgi:hypothetical protein